MPSTYNIKPHKRGDTWEGVAFTILVNDAAVDLTDSSIACCFRDTEGGLQKRMDLTDGIEITDAPAGKFRFTKQVVAWPARSYRFDIEITFANGDVKTYVEGTWVITPDITF